MVQRSSSLDYSLFMPTARMPVNVEADVKIELPGGTAHLTAPRPGILRLELPRTRDVRTLLRPFRNRVRTQSLRNFQQLANQLDLEFRLVVRDRTLVHITPQQSPQFAYVRFFSQMVLLKLGR